MENGVVEHYHANGSYGFVRPSSASRSDESQFVYFPLSLCDVQSPLPRVGEAVVFQRDLMSRRPMVAGLIRISLNRTTPQDEARGPRNQHQRQPDRATQARVATPLRTRPAASSTTPAQVHSEQSLDEIIQVVNTKRQLLADSPWFYPGGVYPRYVYVDVDYLWTSYVRADHVVNRFPGATTTRDLELNLEGLTRRLAQGEHGSRVVQLVAFYLNTPEGVAAKLRRLEFDGVRWDVRKQATSFLQRELLANKPHAPAYGPQTLVLVTGDDAAPANGSGFPTILDEYRNAGWFVEVHAWLSTMATSYIEYQRTYPETAVVRPLDDDDVGEIVRVREAAHGGRAMPKREPATRLGPAPQRQETAVPTTTKNSRSRPKKTASQATRQPRPQPTKAVNDLGGHRSYAHAVRHTADEVRETAHTMHAVAAPRSPWDKTAVSYRPEQYANVIQQLDGPDGDIYIPSGIAMLVKAAGASSSVDLDALRTADVETQRLLLSMALNDEMDAATRRQLSAEAPVY